MTDPAVHIFDREKDLGPEEDSLSDFLLFNIVYESLHGARVGAYAYTSGETGEALEALCVDVGWRPREWLAGSRIYLTQDAYLLYMEQFDNMFAGFRTTAAKDEVLRVIPAEWHDLED